MKGFQYVFGNVLVYNIIALFNISMIKILFINMFRMIW